LLSRCPAVVLAGGLGKRLRSTYDLGPKVLAPIAGRCFLEYILIWLRDAGIRELVLCIGYKGVELRRWLGDGSRCGLHVQYSEEESPLGTAGALKRAEELISGDSFFAMNGDSFLDVSLPEMHRYHSSHSAIATMAVTPQNNSARYGTVQMNAVGEIIGFAEKRVPGQCGHMNGDSAQINGGVYLFRRQFLELIQPGKPVSLEKEVFPRLVDGRLRGFITSSYFIDIGVPADFYRAQRELPERFPYDHTSKSPASN
jgi:D-glycero-alpha-D-manno-heptose 1-phosphate guanylyltransferase